MSQSHSHATLRDIAQAVHSSRHQGALQLSLRNLQTQFLHTSRLSRKTALCVRQGVLVLSGVYLCVSIIFRGETLDAFSLSKCFSHKLQNLLPPINYSSTNRSDVQLQILLHNFKPEDNHVNQHESLHSLCVHVLDCCLVFLFLI